MIEELDRYLNETFSPIRVNIDRATNSSNEHTSFFESYKCTLKDEGSIHYLITLYKNKYSCRFSLDFITLNSSMFSKCLFDQNVTTAQEAIDLLKRDKLFNSRFIKQVKVLSEPRLKELREEIHQFFASHIDEKISVLTNHEYTIIYTEKTAEGVLDIFLGFPENEPPLLTVSLRSGYCRYDLIAHLRIYSLEDMLMLLYNDSIIEREKLLSFLKKVICFV
ncbi:hypothetical protein V6R21_06440 [Limibacter armeniacum]|uniref:hypothetical protein n=1 Tax=Limibacter armeniacum TaxID=466084 RepID=UPI002FE55675